MTELSERGFSALEEGRWDEAIAAFERALNINSEDAYAHTGKLMADLRINKIEQLADLEKPFDQNNNYKRAIRCADESLKAQLIGYNNAIYERTSGETNEVLYQQALALMENKNYAEAIEKFQQVKSYKNSLRLMVECKKEIEYAKKDCVYNEACEILEDSYEQEAIEIAVQKFASIISWKDSKLKIDECREKSEKIKNMSAAERGRLQLKAKEERLNKKRKEEDNHKKNVVVQTDFVNNEKTEAEPVVEEKTTNVTSDIPQDIPQEADLKEEQQTQGADSERKEDTYKPVVADTKDVTRYPKPNNNKTKRNNTAQKLLIVLAACIVGLIIILVVIIFGLMEYNYQKALDLYDDGNYTEAVNTFKTFGFYKDSNGLILKCRYSIAADLLADKKYDEARQAFEELGEYSDSEQMMSEASYLQASDLLEAGNYMAAKEIFENLGQYKNSPDQVLECDYLNALELKDSGETEDAYDLFTSLGDYKDSQQLADEIYKIKKYDEGIRLYREGDYNSAEACFNETEDFEDTEKYLRLITFITSDEYVNIDDLIGFENAAEIILTDDEYLQDFLMGEWRNSQGYYIKYYTEYPSSVIWCSQNIPTTEGEHFKLESGCHYLGSNSSGWKKQWSYEIISKDTIKVHCYKNSSDYTLYR